MGKLEENVSQTALSLQAIKHPDAIAYLDFVQYEKRLSPNTLHSYRRDLGHLILKLEERGLTIKDAQYDDIRNAMVALRRDGQSPASIARYLASWRGFYHHAVRRMDYPVDPTTGLRPPKMRRKLPNTITPDVAAKMLDSEKTQKILSPALLARDKAMFELLYSSGLRVSELVGLDVENLDMREGEARVTGKGSKTRIVPVGKTALAAIGEWYSWRATLAKDGATAVFVSRQGGRLSVRSIQKRLGEWSMASGIGQHVYPHMLRHAFATHVLQSSGDLRAVQEMLGHENISTTQIYTKLDWQSLAKTYDKAHPRAKRMAKQKQDDKKEGP